MNDAKRFSYFQMLSMEHAYHGTSAAHSAVTRRTMKRHVAWMVGYLFDASSYFLLENNPS